MASQQLHARPPIAVVDRVEQIATEVSAAGLPIARSVVILIGGAAAMEGDSADALAPIIRDGVLATAVSHDAIVVDGGTDAGVMALAGQARRDLGSDVPLLGVAPRGRVAVPGVAAATGTTSVEPNHSLVLLVPGDEWGAESRWMVDTAKAVSDGRSVVAVLVDGGPVALSEAVACAAEGWPVVTVQGSGRTADALAEYAVGGTGLDVDIPRSSIRVVRSTAGAQALGAILSELIGSPPSDARVPVAPSAEDYPALYVAASEAAKHGQTMHRRLSLAEITLTTIGLGIVLVTALIQPLLGIPSDVLTGTTVAVSALSFLSALVLKLIGRSTGFDTDWYNGRALAETVKSLSWRYMMRAHPYDEADADRRFASELGHLLGRAARMRQAADRLPSRPHQISHHMRAVRRQTIRERCDYYVTHRLLDQADWYRRRSATASRKGTRWFWLSVLFQLAAAGTALAALAGAGDSVLRIVALLGSIALAIAAWSQLNRYDELSRSYAVAYQELSLIATLADQAADERGLEQLVLDGEQAIGREHRLWIAKRVEAIEAPSDIDEGGDGESE